MYSVITFVFGSAAKNSIRSASSTSILFPMLTKAENPSLSSAADRSGGSNGAALQCDGHGALACIRGQDAQRPWCGWFTPWQFGPTTRIPHLAAFCLTPPEGGLPRPPIGKASGDHDGRADPSLAELKDGAGDGGHWDDDDGQVAYRTGCRPRT